MHQRKSKKILIYFFLLLLVGSINNIGLNNIRFKEISDVNVVGLSDYDNLILLKQIKSLNLDNIFLIDKKKISNQISSNNLVENYDIFKKYPSSLYIEIERTKFLAKINHNGKILFVGSNGKLSENKFSNNLLPFIFGKPNINEFLNFKNIIDQSSFSYDDIKSLYFFSSKRWDIELKNNIIIKLSTNYAKESLQLAFDFLNINNLKDIKIVDARVKNQIILND
jgi:cell division protein FtsQ